MKKALISTNVNGKREITREPNAAEFFLASSGSKLVAAVVAFPHEVIRTRLREQKGTTGKYKGLFSGLRTIFLEEGVRGLYCGMSAHLLRVVPNAGILFLTYESVMLFFRRNHNHNHTSNTSNTSNTSSSH